MDFLKEFIKPELLILVPVLYILGIGMKKSTVKDKLIPALLGGIGIVLSLLWVLGTSELLGWRDVLLAGFSAVTQGILAAGASVYCNQLVKQGEKEE